MKEPENTDVLYPISFLCPNGTIFNQEVFVCEWWWVIIIKMKAGVVIVFAVVFAIIFVIVFVIVFVFVFVVVFVVVFFFVSVVVSIVVSVVVFFAWEQTFEISWHLNQANLRYPKNSQNPMKSIKGLLEAVPGWLERRGRGLGLMSSPPYYTIPYHTTYTILPTILTFFRPKPASPLPPKQLIVDSGKMAKTATT